MCVNFIIKVKIETKGNYVTYFIRIAILLRVLSFFIKIIKFKITYNTHNKFDVSLCGIMFVCPFLHLNTYLRF